MEKKKVSAALLSIAVAASFALAFYAYLMPAESVRKVVEEVVIQKGELRHYAIMSSKSIYGTSASLEYYPEGITESIIGEYHYSINPEKSGNYSFSITTTYYVQDGRTKVVLWKDVLYEEEGDFNGSLTLPMNLNFSEINERFKAVKEGTAMPRIEKTTEIVFNAATQRENFSHSITLENRNGLYSFTDANKSTRNVYSSSNVTENQFGFTSVEKARILYTAMAALLMIPLIATNIKSIRRTKKTPYVVSGRLEGNRVILDSEEDLKKVFQMLDSPVIKTERDGEIAYAINANGVCYEFRKRD